MKERIIKKFNKFGFCAEIYEMIYDFSMFTESFVTAVNRLIKANTSLNLINLTSVSLVKVYSHLMMTAVKFMHILISYNS